MELKHAIESLLFVSNKPLSLKRHADVLGEKKEDIREAVEGLVADYDARDGGLIVLRNGEEFQIATDPEHGELVKAFLKDEAFGELTRPSLEALTIVAYRGPLTKPELEQIRGVNCSLILRNLMIRGLVTQEGESFRITMDFLRHLGITSVEDLPDYGTLNSDENLKKLLDDQEGSEGKREAVSADSGQESATTE
jgi:segregation and condensation protein B